MDVLNEKSGIIKPETLNVRFYYSMFPMLCAAGKFQSVPKINAGVKYPALLKK